MFIESFTQVLGIFFSINSFYTTGLYLYPLKTSENLWFSDVFRRYRKRPVGFKWVNLLVCNPNSHMGRLLNTRVSNMGRNKEKIESAVFLREKMYIKNKWPKFVTLQGGGFGFLFCIYLLLF